VWGHRLYYLEAPARNWGAPRARRAILPDSQPDPLPWSEVAPHRHLLWLCRGDRGWATAAERRFSGSDSRPRNLSRRLRVVVPRDARRLLVAGASGDAGEPPVDPARGMKILPFAAVVVVLG